MSHLSASRCHSFRVGDRGVKITSLPTRRRFQLRTSQLFPEGWQPCCRAAWSPHSHRWDGSDDRGLPRKENTQGREDRGAKLVSREHFLHKALAPCGHLTSLCALGRSLGLWQVKTEQISLHTRTPARTHHLLSPRLHLITPDALFIAHSPNTRRLPPQPSPPPQLCVSPLPGAWNKLPTICINSTTPHSIHQIIS